MMKNKRTAVLQTLHVRTVNTSAVLNVGDCNRICITRNKEDASLSISHLQKQMQSKVYFVPLLPPTLDTFSHACEMKFNTSSNANIFVGHINVHKLAGGSVFQTGTANEVISRTGPKSIQCDI